MLQCMNCRSDHTFLILKVLKGADIGLKRAFGIKRRLSQSRQPRNQLLLGSDDPPCLGRAVRRQDQFSVFFPRHAGDLSCREAKLS